MIFWRYLKRELCRKDSEEPWNPFHNIFWCNPRSDIHHAAMLRADPFGTVVANLYYCQPLLIEYSRSFSVTYDEVSRIPTLIQAG